MWIAKPIESLTADERVSWIQLQNDDHPISQTLRWGEAAKNAGARTWLIFSPDEKVGGLVLELSSKGNLECINGPLLNWISRADTPRQLATFAMSAAKAVPHFKSLKILPRWTHEYASDFSQFVPIASTQQHEAATLIVSLCETKDEQVASLSRRLKRNLKRAEKEQIETKWLTIDNDNLREFAEKLGAFAKEKNFYAPSLSWLETLTKKTLNTEDIRFGIVRSEIQTLNLSTQLLIAIYKNTAHYLFGFDERPPKLKSALSSASAAHLFAMNQAKTMGAKNYDFNGYVLSSSPDDNYAGVCEFKKQWNGKTVRFTQPEYLIE